MTGAGERGRERREGGGTKEQENKRRKVRMRERRRGRFPCWCVLISTGQIKAEPAAACQCVTC